MWFTDLLHICDNISHLQTELIIMFLCKVKQNHCFCCERMCGEGGSMGGGVKRRREDERQGEHVFASNVGGVR